MAGLAALLLAGAAALRRGDLSVTRGFLSERELTTLRAHLLHNYTFYLGLMEKRDSYPRGKQLLDFHRMRKACRRCRFPESVQKMLGGTYLRAQEAAMAMPWESKVYDMAQRNAKNAQMHVSFHPKGSDFPPHVDSAPNCVAILIYLTGSGDDFDGGQLQTRGCPGLMQCPTSRTEYNLNVSTGLACQVLEEHRPQAGDMVAFLAETAHAVATVTRGMRIAMNTWINCPYREAQPKKVCKERQPLEEGKGTSLTQGWPFWVRTATFDKEWSSRPRAAIPLGRRAYSGPSRERPARSPSSRVLAGLRRERPGLAKAALRPKGPILGKLWTSPQMS